MNSQQRQKVESNLIAFVERVTQKKATNAEIATLPEVAMILLDSPERTRGEHDGHCMACNRPYSTDDNHCWNCGEKIIRDK